MRSLKKVKRYEFKSKLRCLTKEFMKELSQPEYASITSRLKATPGPEGTAELEGKRGTEERL